jgi:hypothetical protein
MTFREPTPFEERDLARAKETAAEIKEKDDLIQFLTTEFFQLIGAARNSKDKTTVSIANHHRNKVNERLGYPRSDERHTHVNKGDGTDSCKVCGWDLRDEIHLRVGEAL